MNYRHAFHAGNFADVLKHAVLARILVHLRAKPAAFRVIDTHAGAGRYDLAGPEANRGGEWRDGIGRLLDAAIGEKARALLDPYLVVSSSLALETVTFPPIRFVCKVDELAFTGTEAVATPSHTASA